MNTNWSKILLFSLLSFALGFLVARTCCGGGGCHKGGGACHGESRCEHGGGCCAEGGTCDKEGCDHTMGGSCCKDGGHGEGKGAHCGGHHAGHGHGDRHGEGHEEHIHAIVHSLKDAGFQGDTLIKEGDCTITIGLHGGKTEVKVEMNDSVKVEEKTVEVHAH